MSEKPATDEQVAGLKDYWGDAPKASAAQNHARKYLALIALIEQQQAQLKVAREALEYYAGTAHSNSWRARAALAEMVDEMGGDDEQT